MEGGEIKWSAGGKVSALQLACQRRKGEGERAGEKERPALSNSSSNKPLGVPVASPRQAGSTFTWRERQGTQNHRIETRPCRPGFNGPVAFVVFCMSESSALFRMRVSPSPCM